MGSEMAETLAELFQISVSHDKSDAILTKESGTYEPISSRELERRVVNLHLALRAAGIEPGEKFALLAENRWEWAVADFAMMTAGIISVPLYPTLPADKVQYLLAHSESRGVFCSTSGQIEKIQEIRGELPDLGLVVAFDDVDAVGVTQLESMIGSEDPGDDGRGKVRSASDAVAAEDLASIIYTSGTTGVPKGVMLSHGNICTNIRDSTLDVGADDTALSFLPLCHIAERLADYVYFVSGATVAYAESLETVAVNMGEVRPTLAVGVPRFYEKVYGRVMAAMAQASPVKRTLFNWSVGVGKEALPYRVAGKSLPGLLAIKHAIADKLVFQKLRGRLGGRIRMLISGAAPLARHLAEFFYALGLPIYEGYGLTETSPLVSINTQKNLKFGTVGKIIPNVDVQIADDGEILVRGPNIMQGYYKMEQETAEAMDGDWFHTGDIGQFDDEGYLSITDRKKDMFKTSAGSYVVPAPIENLLKASPLVETAVVIAQSRKFPSALIVPDFPALRAWAESERISVQDNRELCANAAVQDHMMAEVEDRCHDLVRYQRIKKISLIPHDFSIEGGELTPTMKVRRKEVDEKYAQQIEEIYS